MKPFLFALALLSMAGACSPPQPTPLPPPPGAAFPDKLGALGTEPFWSLGIDGDTVTYSSLEQPAKRTARFERQEAAGELALGGMLGGEPATIKIARKPCSDGMSDRTYVYTVTMRLGLQQLNGCASPGQIGRGE